MLPTAFPFFSRAVVAVGGLAPTAGMALWLKADGLTGLSDGDPVTTWPDSSGNGNDATGSGGTRPTYETGILNGMPAVYFGTGKTMATGLTLAVPFTLFLVEKSDAASQGATRTLTASATTNALMAPNRGASNSVYANGTVSNYAVGDANGHVAVLRIGAGANSTNYRVDGVDRTGSSAPSCDWTSMVIGAGGNGGVGEPASSYVAEVIGYPFALSDPECEATEDYLRDRYAIS